MWYFTNDGQGEKIDWHYYRAAGAPLNPTIEYTFDQLESMYWLVRPDGSEGPYLTIYSAREGDGQDASTTYRSRWLYDLVPGTFTRGEWCLAYRGNNPSADVFPGLPRVELQYDSFASVGPRGGSEGIIYEVVSSNSGASAGAEAAAHALIGLQRTNGKDYFSFVFP